MILSGTCYLRMALININAHLSTRVKHCNRGINSCYMFLLLNNNTSLFYAIKFFLDFDGELMAHEVPLDKS